MRRVVEENEVGTGVVLKGPWVRAAVAFVEPILGQLFELVGRRIGAGDYLGHQVAGRWDNYRGT